MSFITYKQKFNKKYGFGKEESHSIPEISKITGFKESGLRTIFNKGVGAFKSGGVRPSVKSPEQWAQARIYAALDKTSKAHKIDKVHLMK